MENRRAALRVGLFTLAGIVALLALIFFLSGSALHPGLPYETYFQESVQGLDIGTAVKFRGVTIGKITDIGLAPAEYPPNNPNQETQKVYQLVVVRFRVDPNKLGHVTDIQQAINSGLRVQLASQGITGLAYLELSFAPPATYPPLAVPWQPQSQVIPSMPSTLTQVQDAAEQIMSSLSKIDLGKMIGNVNDLILSLKTAVNGANLPATTAAIRTLTGGPQTTQIISQLDQTTAQLAKVSAQLPVLITQSQATLAQADETTADLQSQLAPILQNLKTTTDSLRQLSASLQRNPAQVLLGAQPPPEGDR